MIAVKYLYLKKNVGNIVEFQWTISIGRNLIYVETLFRSLFFQTIRRKFILKKYYYSRLIGQ